MSSTTAVRATPTEPRTRQRTSGTVAALALFESRRLLLSPLLWVGAGITLFLLFGVNWARDNRYNLFTTALGGLAATTLLCLNLAALRPRRHRAEELYVTQPASPSLSTAALLVAGIAPAVLGAVLLAVGYVVEDAGSGLALWAPGYGESPRGAIATLHEVARTPTIPELAQGPLAIVVVGALGVALARWLPLAKLAPLWVFLFLAGELTLTGWNLTEGPAHWFMPFTDAAVATRGAEWPCSAGSPCGFDRFAVGSAWWHLLYLAGLVAAFAGAALWRDRPGRRSALLGLGGLTVAVFAGVLQVP